ncbi:Serpentine Receptor, class E (Epsilon) [Caenorhabditis elegans]|uniref:Serpentine Receptor, class E (Epsilon) n=1 Tax=Caenorhabditis elegans TaxID=6239 RepID=Q7YTP5_CAEEL|nr:Serpentine Receptor, class E (Epsilon) [Caenorhabditis elegans]CAE17777.1 Serpentine Receptor, class E (Epsilon) [Caenorhabditis elegans]|eukprot:NP_001023787.1 Uncharacterized protein CELE_F11A5.15 [Caenorhabditis elegans]
MTGISKISKRKSIYILIISNIFFFIIPLYLIVIGIWKLTSCPSNQLLPPLMIILALLIIADRLLFWWRLYNETKFEKTFPRPSAGSMERLKTWDKNRASSSTRSILCLVWLVRVMLLVAVITGIIWTSKEIWINQCDPLITISVLFFCAFFILIFLFCILGSIYVFMAKLFRNIEQTYVACLNRLMIFDEK